MMKTKIAQKMALAQTNGFFSAFRIPTSYRLLHTAAHMCVLIKLKTKIAQKMAVPQTNGFSSAFRIPTNSPLLQTATQIGEKIGKKSREDRT